MNALLYSCMKHNLPLVYCCIGNYQQHALAYKSESVRTVITYRCKGLFLLQAANLYIITRKNSDPFRNVVTAKWNCMG